MKNKQTEPWYLKYPHQILPFAKLSIPYQLAIVHYMAVDGEAWQLEGFPAQGMVRNWKINKKYLQRTLPEFVKKYGKIKFGVTTLPAKTMIAQVWNYSDIQNSFSNFTAYHQWYIGACVKNPNHPKKNRWACILNDNCELLQDGWHRFHCYIHQKAKEIPCVFYP